jgi:tripartite-type tricarboxylate transporter receptor subunit TctC
MKLICCLFAALSTWAVASHAMAQTSYPEKPIRILVGFPSGGPPDIAARLLADRFSESWGQPVVVENVTGAGGNIAIDRTVKAAPDGYTLVMASSAITINPSLYERATYHTGKDLAPISVAVFTPSILVVNNEVPARNVQELIELARAQPGKLTYGHAGLGTPAHLSGEVLKSLASIDMVPVSYRGIPALLPDVVAGRVTMTLPNMSVVLPLVREGKLRALATISHERALAMDFNVPIWFGLMAPAGTPQPVINKLHREMLRSLTNTDVRKRLDDAGLEVVANTPTEFAAIIKSEVPRWAKLIKDAGIKVSN